MIDHNIFVQRLRRAMWAKNMTADDLSRASGLTVAAISNILYDGAMPRARVLRRLARALFVSPAWLRGLTKPGAAA